MTEIKIGVRVRKGRFNWLDSSQVSIAVTITVGKRRVSLSFPEDEGWWFDVDDWADYIPAALKAWLKATWISTQEHRAKVILRWAESEAGQITLHNTYVQHRKEQILKETMKLTDRIDKLNKEFQSLHEWED